MSGPSVAIGYILLIPSLLGIFHVPPASVAKLQAEGCCIGACGTGMAAVVAILSFAGGLVGWLLLRKALRKKRKS